MSLQSGSPLVDCIKPWDLAAWLQILSHSQVRSDDQSLMVKMAWSSYDAWSEKREVNPSNAKDVNSWVLVIWEPTCRPGVRSEQIPGLAMFHQGGQHVC